MAIQYIGTTISGIASDTKPSIGAETISANEKGVIFIETDTNKIYQWDGDSWNLTTAADATTSAKGVASFDSGDFSVSSGAVSLADNITIAGNLTVSGTTTTVNATNLLIEDPLLVLAKDQSGSAAWDAGFVVERGNDNNMALIWDESTDKFSFIQANGEVGSTAGNVTISNYADLKAKGIEATNTLAVTGNSTLSGTTTTTGLLTMSGGFSSTGAGYLGVNDTGIDVTFYGTTAGRYMKWSGASGNNLLFSDNAKIYLGTGNDLSLIHI